MTEISKINMVIVKRLKTGEVFTPEDELGFDRVIEIAFQFDRIEVQIARGGDYYPSLILLCPWPMSGLDVDAVEDIDRSQRFGNGSVEEGRITWPGRDDE